MNNKAQPVEMSENVEQEWNADDRTYSVEGDHYEIGYETAKRSGEIIEPGTSLSGDARITAEKSREVTKEVFPAAVSEFDGYSDALGIPDDEMLWHFTPGIDGSCSAMAIETDDGILIGRNYDFFYSESRRHFIHTVPDQGYAHVGVHEGLVGGRFDGLNDQGLFVSFNGAGFPDHSAVGMPFHLVVRYLLAKCESAVDARDTLRDLPLREPKSYLLADSDSAFVVEAHPEQTAVRTPNAGLLVATNHFIHSEMEAFKPPWDNSVQRRNRLLEFSNLDSPTIEDLQVGLRDHEAPVCGHEDGMATLWSCVSELSTGRISYALGAPCRNRYSWTITPRVE
ncbi:C45 family autoproteolytic acyltransferase/hydolase [Halocatena marina]|uniref:C45 family autoproteolytic acyltransferase/hydrolase n=1 Tax=Halocatena marina TaxID=2934937 RepID=A0ABD5YSJ4_9EURY|nr:C45 family peptidase [Halocatena marina]